MRFFLRHLLAFFGLLICVTLVSFNYSVQMRDVAELPSSLVRYGEDESYALPHVPSPFSYELTEPAATSSSESLGSGASTMDITLFGFKVKQISLLYRTEKLYIPGGQAIGVALYTSGILVVGTGEFTAADGHSYSPAAAAGIEAGDVLLQVDGKEIKDAAAFSRLCNDSNGKSIVLTVSRDGAVSYVTVTPMADAADGIYRIGVWSRDSTSGIGTVAFSDPETNRFYALGHSVTDLDTAVDISIDHGEAVEARLSGVTPGKYGRAGELRGSFSSASPRLGAVDRNDEFGISGTLYKPLENRFFPNGIPIASASEARIGTAQLISTVDREGLMVYNCSVIKTHRQQAPSQKGIVIEITDPVLIDKTGGIVQGMSGSPLIQNGKIIGVLTHVFLNDPLRGYCAYAEWVVED